MCTDLSAMPSLTQAATMARKGAAKAVMMERLEGTATLEVWLTDNGVDWEMQSAQELQKHRHEWLKMLIEEFENGN